MTFVGYMDMPKVGGVDIFVQLVRKVEDQEMSSDEMRLKARAGAWQKGPVMRYLLKR